MNLGRHPSLIVHLHLVIGKRSYDPREIDVVEASMNLSTGSKAYLYLYCSKVNLTSIQTISTVIIKPYNEIT